MSKPYRIYVVCDRVALHPPGKDSWTVAVYERATNPHVQRWQPVANPAVVESQSATRRRTAGGALLAGNEAIDLNDGVYVGKQPVTVASAWKCRYCPTNVPLTEENREAILDAAYNAGKTCLRLHALAVGLSQR